MVQVQQQSSSIVDFASLPADGTGGLGGRVSPLAGGSLAPADGVAPQWWSGAGGTSGTPQSPPNTAAGGGVLGVLNALLGSLNAMIDGLGAAFQSGVNESNAEGAPVQNVTNATFSSSGDPHLAETGTATGANGNPISVNTHFDSMSSQNDLVSSTDFTGGYRVSTTVTNPNANGVTQNQRATVHTNGDQDQVTMNADGSYAIDNAGTNVALAAGQTTALAGGEIVSHNLDGSLTVTEQDAQGGLISTTMHANGGGGVDLQTSVQNAAVGGAIATEAQTPSAAAVPLPKVRD